LRFAIICQHPGGGTRTRTLVLPTTDFKSVASANSATPGNSTNLIHGEAENLSPLRVLRDFAVKKNFYREGAKNAKNSNTEIIRDRDISH
jgi:hypothetical protein